MLTEITTEVYAIYTQELREAKDAYTLRKTQKDRKKLKIWLNTILLDRQVIVFYKQDNEEKVSIITKSIPGLELPDAKIEAETVGYKTYLVCNYILANEVPSNKPIAIHTDSITKFICQQDGLKEISNKIIWHGHGHY